MSQGYAFAAAPQAVAGSAHTQVGRYRASKGANGAANNNTGAFAKDKTMASNLMHDKRIVRGSTFALANRIAARATPGMPGATGPYHAQQQQQQLAATRRAPSASAAPAAGGAYYYDALARASTPPAVEGRVHTEVQTDNYLEDLREAHNKVEFGTQTLPELDRPSAPLFKPLEPIFYPLSEAKSIALMTDAAELFDFDLTVEPLLAALCDRGIEDAMMDVLEEEEQKEMRKGALAFQQQHAAAVEVMHAKEHRETRLAAETEARIVQEKAYLADKQAAASQQAARTAARDALRIVAESALARLDNAGYFYDPVARQAVVEFLPALVDQVQRRADRVAAVAAETEKMVLAAVQQAVVAQSRARAALVKEAVDEAERFTKYVITTTQISSIFNAHE